MKLNYCEDCDELIKNCTCNLRIKARNKVKPKKMHANEERIIKKKTKRREDKTNACIHTM